MDMDVDAGCWSFRMLDAVHTLNTAWMLGAVCGFGVGGCALSFGFGFCAFSFYGLLFRFRLSGEAVSFINSTTVYAHAAQYKAYSLRVCYFCYAA